MKLKVIISCYLIALFFSACGVTWTSINQKKVSQEKIKDAKKKCKVDDKLYKLNESRINTDNIIFILEQNGGLKPEGKKYLLNRYKKEEKKVNTEINVCMKNEGFIRK